jgi:copper chaperone CopZ
MKTLLTTLLLFTSTLLTAYAQPTETGELAVKTSVVCGMCKDTIEKNLAFAKGVKSARVDVDTKTLYVKYNPKKTTAHDIKKAITELGYSADEMQPTAEAIEKLHFCCKPDSKH